MTRFKSPLVYTRQRITWLQKQQQWRIPLKNPVNSDKTFFDISVNTGQIGMGFEADTQKNDSNMPNVCDFQTKI